LKAALLDLQGTDKQWRRTQPKKSPFLWAGLADKVNELSKHTVAVSMSFQTAANIFSFSKYYL